MQVNVIYPDPTRQFSVPVTYNFDISLAAELTDKQQGLNL